MPYQGQARRNTQSQYYATISGRTHPSNRAFGLSSRSSAVSERPTSILRLFRLRVRKSGDGASKNGHDFSVHPSRKYIQARVLNVLEFTQFADPATIGQLSRSVSRRPSNGIECDLLESCFRGLHSRKVHTPTTRTPVEIRPRFLLARQSVANTISLRDPATTNYVDRQPRKRCSCTPPQPGWRASGSVD